MGAAAFEFVLQDVARVPADAIVNASNPSLTLGGGVSAAIRAACPAPGRLQAAMSAAGPIEPGDAVVTASFGLAAAPWLIHAASARGGAPVVGRAFASVFAMAARRRFRCVALPALGAGTGRVPLVDCARLARQAVHDASALSQRVIFALHDGAALRVFAQVFDAWPGPAESRRIG